MFRSFVLMLCLAAAAGAQTDSGWMKLFDGRSMNGWKAAENQSTWKVVDGLLTADGPRSHLFYTGPVRNADFRNFEIAVEAKASRGANSGVYFHTKYQEKGWPFASRACQALESEDKVDLLLQEIKTRQAIQ